MMGTMGIRIIMDRIIMGRIISGWGQLDMYRCLTFWLPLLLLNSHTTGKSTIWWSQQISIIRLTFSPPDWEFTCCPLDPRNFVTWDGPAFLQLLTAGSWVWLVWCSETFTEDGLSTKSGIRGPHGSLPRGDLRWELDNSYINCSHTWSFFLTLLK